MRSRRVVHAALHKKAIGTLLVFFGRLGHLGGRLPCARLLPFRFLRERDAEPAANPATVSRSAHSRVADPSAAASTPSRRGHIRRNRHFGMDFLETLHLDVDRPLSIFEIVELVRAILIGNHCQRRRALRRSDRRSGQRQSSKRHDSAIRRRGSLAAPQSNNPRQKTEILTTLRQCIQSFPSRASAAKDGRYDPR